MSFKRRAALGVAAVSAAVLVGGSFAWACTPEESQDFSSSPATGEAGPSPASAPAPEPAPAPVAASEPAPAPAQTAAPEPAPSPATATASAPAPRHAEATARRATRTAARPSASSAPSARVADDVTPAPAASEPAPAEAVPAPATPAPSAGLLTGDLWSALDSPGTFTSGPAPTPARSTDSRNGQLGLGIALVGAGIAALAGSEALARRRAVAVRAG